MTRPPMLKAEDSRPSTVEADVAEEDKKGRGEKGRGEHWVSRTSRRLVRGFPFWSLGAEIQTLVITLSLPSFEVWPLSG